MAMQLLDRDPETHAVIGAAMAVHCELGPGFLEAVYCEALEMELRFRCVSSRREVLLPIHYHGHLLSCKYQVDFICQEHLLVEVKALKALTGIDDAQVLNYLKASSLRKALLLNFGAASLEFRRFVK